MKHLFFLLLLIVVITAISQQAQAQTQEFSLAGELIVPTGQFSDSWNLGAGATARFEKTIGKKMAWTATGGVSYNPGKSLYGIKIPGVTFIPFQVGAKYYIEEQMKGFYFSGEIGFHHVITSHSSGTVSGFSYDIPSTSETDLSYAPGVGYHATKADIGFRYNIISPSSGSNVTYFGIRIAAILK